MSSITATIDSATKSASISVSLPSVTGNINVYRVAYDTGGITPVRGGEPATLVAHAWSGVDYEIPIDEEFYYIADYSTGQISSSVALLSNPNRECWLRHLSNPALSVQIFFTKVPELTRDVIQDSLDAIGRKYPLVVSSTQRKAAASTLELYTQSADEVGKLWAILEDDSVLLLMTPEDYLLGVNTYISIGSVGVSSPHGKAFIPLRTWSMPFQVVDRPSGVGASIGGFHITYGSVAAQFASYADAATPRAGYPTPTYKTMSYGNGTIPLGPTG